MELKAGYKQTEVGVIPKDWGVAEIGDLNPYVTSGSRGWAEFYSDMGSPFIRITNLSRESIYLDLKDLKLVRLPAGMNEGTRTQLQDGDVLISITADIGIVGYVDSTVPKPAFINQHIALVRFDPAKIDGRFVSRFLACENSQKLFRGSTDQGAKAGMTLGTIRKIRMALPRLNEQRAIAGALSDVDALIGALDKLIAKKRDIKQAAMQQLLTGKQRLPGFNEEWKVKRLGDVAHIKTGKKNNEDKVEDGAYPFFVRSQTVERINTYSFDGEAILVPGEGGIGSIFHYINGKFD
ncbi:MAG: restriction endonuclease subunit S, partial [Bryobacteraceae bacterium]